MRQPVLVDACGIPLERLKICFIKFLMGKDSPLANEDGPHVHFSWHDPGAKIQPHYHTTDEFAIGLEGESIFPDSRVGPLDFHYTDSGVAKGPIAIQHGVPFAHAVLRRKEAGVVYLDSPRARPSVGGRQIFGIERNADWERINDGLQRKVVMGSDGKGPTGEIFECKKGAIIQRGSAPFGEFNIFYRGFFETEGKTVQGYAIRYIEGDAPPPSIKCQMDGGLIIAARFGKPVSSPRD